MEKVIKLGVRGMSCGGCALAVQSALEKVAGVKSTSVDHKTGTAEVFFEQKMPDTESMLRALKEAGYSGGFSS